MHRHMCSIVADMSEPHVYIYMYTYIVYVCVFLMWMHAAIVHVHVCYLVSLKHTDPQRRVAEALHSLLHLLSNFPCPLIQGHILE